MADFEILDKETAPAQAPPAPARKRDERPKFSLKEDLGYRIEGLEKARLDPAMSKADIAALDRYIVKLKQKKAEKDQAKAEKDEV